MCGYETLDFVISELSYFLFICFYVKQHNEQTYKHTNISVTHNWEPKFHIMV